MGTNASFIFYRKSATNEEHCGRNDSNSTNNNKKESAFLDKKNLYELLGVNGVLSNCISINGIKYKDYFEIPGALTFSLKIIYPGLVIGAGYEHPIVKKDPKSIEPSDFQLGFFFDHTTGMPVIPGSSVKGIIKSVFPKKIPKDAKEEEKELLKKINCEKLQYVNKALNYSNLINEENWETLFDKEDIFYDAFIDIDKPPRYGKVFAEDYITPHKSQFSDPTPLRFLKIAPGVTFIFQFKLVDTKINDLLISKENKLNLFKKIVSDFGVGAKRNVGYGNFVEG